MNRAVFLDRDGTINVEKHYLYKIEEFEYLPGALAGLKLLQSLGYLLVIITNQSGIGRGYYKEEDFKVLNEWMLKDLENKRIHINKVYYCPHHPDAQIERYRISCTCRKPALGMYEKAIEDFNIDLSQSWAIGDSIRDCAICEKTKCKGFLIGNHERTDIINNVINNMYFNVKYALNLEDASKIIASER